MWNDINAWPTQLLHCSPVCLLQVKAGLLTANLKCDGTIAGMGQSHGTAWQQVNEAQEELQRQHLVAMISLRQAEARDWCASLRAAGNMLSGHFVKVHIPHCHCTYAVTATLLFMVLLQSQS